MKYQKRLRQSENIRQNNQNFITVEEINAQQDFFRKNIIKQEAICV